MRQCWSGQPFDFQGRFHSAERLHVRPRPAQQPHPPLFMASNSEDSVRSAARLGLPTLSAFFVPLAELIKRHHVYREEAFAAGHAEAEVERLEHQSWGMRVVHVATHHDEAVRATEAPFMGYQHRMARLRSEGTGGGLADSFDRSFVRLRPFREYLDSGVALVGTPDEVTATIRRVMASIGTFEQASLQADWERAARLKYEAGELEKRLEAAEAALRDRGESGRALVQELDRPAQVVCRPFPFLL